MVPIWSAFIWLLALSTSALRVPVGRRATASTDGTDFERQKTNALSFGRRAGVKVLVGGGAASLLGGGVVGPARAFSGGGSSAYAGRAPASKLDRRKALSDRVSADAADFAALGAAIAGGDTDGAAWVAWFVQEPRRAPDAVGRSYGGLADLVGHVTDDRKTLEGAAGYLLAAAFAKAGKPPDNAPAVQAYKALAKTFAPVAAAGKRRNADAAAKAYAASAAAFDAYLAAVELPPLPR